MNPTTTVLRPVPSPDPASAGAPRRLSLLTPSGRLTLGNHLGALRQMARAQDEAECFYGVADLHALTTPRSPADLRATVREQATLLLAAGLDRSTLFVQSRVATHARLGHLLECVATTGELGRMTQYKEKARAQESVRASLLTYPVLMAADILLYRTERVPVGDDQRQHVELTRDLAIRFNHAYGEVFTIPEITVPAVGARVMDLVDPTRKMSKSGPPAGVIALLDPPDVVRRKVARAVTDSDTGRGSVRRDRDAKPGVTNLLEILAACGGSDDGITTYGALKAAVTDAVVAELEPLQRRHAELATDPAYVDEVFGRGADRCLEVTTPVLEAAVAALGIG